MTNKTETEERIGWHRATDSLLLALRLLVLLSQSTQMQQIEEKELFLELAVQMRMPHRMAHFKVDFYYEISLSSTLCS